MAANVRINSTLVSRMEDLVMGDYFLYSNNLYLTLPWDEESEFNCYNFNDGHFECMDWDEEVVKISSNTLNITVG